MTTRVSKGTAAAVPHYSATHCLQRMANRPGGPARGALTLLLVEDQQMIAKRMTTALESSGYAVVWHSTGEGALRFLATEGLALAGLVTDIRLGAGPKGWDVARRARELDPAMVVVYMTGDSGHEWKVEGVCRSQLLQKPFAATRIIETLATLFSDAADPVLNAIPYAGEERVRVCRPPACIATA